MNELQPIRHLWPQDMTLGPELSRLHNCETSIELGMPGGKRGLVQHIKRVIRLYEARVVFFRAMQCHLNAQDYSRKVRLWKAAKRQARHNALGGSKR